MFQQNEQIGVVSTFSELVKTDFKGKNNALCWYRNLEGDFEEIVAQLQLKENITEVSAELYCFSKNWYSKIISDSSSFVKNKPSW